MEESGYMLYGWLLNISQRMRNSEQIETYFLCICVASHRIGQWIAFWVPQEHLQELRKQYRARVEAMRGQVQQLTARHETCKKELAASETVSV